MTKISDLEYGPIYNPLNSNGLPLLGAWEKARPEPIIDDLSPTPKQFESYIPFEGPVILNSVWIDNDNKINYSCGFKDAFSALLFNDDFEIAERLIFQDNIVYPEFYFDFHGGKVFNPSWLGETDFGRTLYACQYFINQLVFQTHKFDVAPKEIFFNPNWHDPVKSMIEYIPVIREQSSIKEKTHTVFIKAQNLTGNIEGNLNKNDYVGWNFTDIDLDITYEIVDLVTGVRVESGSDFFNKHREAFPQLIPNFERLRQLFKLLYGLSELKQAGYENSLISG